MKRDPKKSQWSAKEEAQLRRRPIARIRRRLQGSVYLWRKSYTDQRSRRSLPSFTGHLLYSWSSTLIGRVILIFALLTAARWLIGN